MKLKKLTSLLLSATMLVSTAFYAPVRAEESATSQYFDSLKTTSSWEKVKSDSLTKFLASVSDKNEKHSIGYDIAIKEAQDVKNFKSSLEIKFTPKTSESPAIPDIKVYFDKDSFYINKEVVNAISPILGLDKTFQKDYVKVSLKELGLDEEILKTISKDQSKTAQKAIDFLKKIDLGIDLGLTKEGNSYKISMDADKMVDVFNAYIKYLFTNFDVFLDFYKEVLGVDILDVYNEMGLNVTKEQLNADLAKSLEMWKKEVEPKLPMIKTILKGSTFTSTTTFEDGKYNSSFDLSLNLDAKKAEELFNEEAKKEGKEIPPTSSAPFTSANLAFSVDSTVTNAPDLEINAPTSFEEFNLVKYFEEQQKKMNDTIKKMEATKEEATKETKTPVNANANANKPQGVKSANMEKPQEIVVNFSTKKANVEALYDSSEHKVDVRMVKGNLEIATKDMKKLVPFAKLNSKQKYVDFKKTMTSLGYDVVWNQTDKTSTATEK